MYTTVCVLYSFWLALLTRQVFLDVIPHLCEPPSTTNHPPVVIFWFAGCVFEVAAYTTDRSSLPLQLWVEDEECERSLGAPEPAITPIKSAKLGNNVLQIQLYAEC